MAANLTSVVMQLLTPEVISQIASFLGLDRAATQKAAGGTVPALLAGLSDIVATPAGTSRLSKLLSQQQPGSFTDLLRQGDPQGLAQAGSGLLSGLFGGRTMDTMAQAVGKFAGTGDSGGKSLLSVLAPIVLGALGQQQRETGIDAHGLASLLRSQKDQYVAAIPSGLADQLGAAGLIDKVEAGARSGMAAASAAGSRIANASDRAGDRATQAASAARAQWPYWVVGLAVLAGLAWFLMGRNQQVAEQTPTPPATTQATITPPKAETTGMAPANLTVDGVNLASQFNSSVDTLKSTLTGITDVAGAQAALPKINDLTAQLDGMKTQAAKLTPEGRSEFAKLIGAVTPAIDEMCDKVLALPGVGPVAKATIDDLRAKMVALTRA